jgi:predicted MFS family arabinose efflux permease
MAVLLAAGTTYALSQTLIVPALPALVRQLGASPLAVSWLLTAYLVAASVATPLIGRLGDLFGRGRVLTWVMAIFCVGSIVCAVGQSLPLLMLGRILQGVAGGVFPLAYGIIRDTFPTAAHARNREPVGEPRGRLRAGAGDRRRHRGSRRPLRHLLGGHDGAIPALAAARIVPERPAGPRARIDWLGAVLLAGALTALLIVMTQGQRLGWTSAATLGVAVVGALLARRWVAVERERAAPLLDLALLRRRTLALTNMAALCVGCGIFMAYVPLAAIAQAPRATGYGFGLSVAAAGALLVPHGVTQILAGPWTGGLCARIGSRATLIIGTSLSASTMAAITAFHGSPFSLLAAGGVLGLGQAFALTAMANLVVGAVAAGDVGIATGINGVMRTVGMALGSAMSAAIVASGSASGLPTDHAYAVAFAVAACTTAGAASCAVAIRRPAAGLSRVAHTAAQFEPGS